MELAEIIQIVTSGLLGIFATSSFILRRNYKELFEKYWKLRSENLEEVQRNALYELYSSNETVEKVKEAAIRIKRKPTKGGR